jgi:group II intron reverse transcriptase/maturase
LTRFETIFNKYFNKLLSKNKSSVKSNDITTLITAEKLAIVFNKLEIYLNNVNNSNKNNNSHININLIDILSDVNFLFYAWCLIKDKGEKMSGIDQVPIQNIGYGTLRRLSNDLENGIYKPKPVSRIYLTKPNGFMRPLGVPTTRDKIVQKALTLILEPLFESTFSNNSHGFRPQRSCHTALDQIRREWRSVSYFIEIDLAKCFDKLGHKLILESIYKKCPNKSIVQIINKMLKCGYVNLQNASDANLEQQEGTPQGSIISPLLANIALDNFDKHIENLILPKYSLRQKYTKAQMSEEYSKATRIFDIQDYKLRDDLVNSRNLTTRQARQVVQSLKVKQAINNNIKYTIQDENTERLWYVRYADDMLFGFVGPKYKVYVIISEIVAYLQNIGVDINIDKSGIKHHSKGTSFLSYNIFGNYSMRTKHKNKFSSKEQRVSRTTLHFSAPVNVLLQRARERGFFMSNKRGRKINSKLVARRYDK